MAEERIARALARIENAAQRIGAVAARPRAENPDLQMAERHEALKRETAAAIAGIDRLIGTLEQ